MMCIGEARLFLKDDFSEWDSGAPLRAIISCELPSPNASCSHICHLLISNLVLKICTLPQFEITDRKGKQYKKLKSPLNLYLQQELLVTFSNVIILFSLLLFYLLVLFI